MKVQDRAIQLVDELISGIDAGDFQDVVNIPEKYTYEYLWALFFLSDTLEDAKSLYEQVYDFTIQHGKAHIREKMEKGEKVKVAFLTISAAEWPAEQIYRMLGQNEKVESYVVVSPLSDRDRESRRDTYRQTFEYFERNGYEVRGGYNEASDTCVAWRDLGGIPDIIIHLTSWYESLPWEFRITSFPLRCINCYIPYGVYVANSVDGSYVKKYVYNKDFVNMMWRVYADSELNLKGYQEHSLLHGKNVLYSGYIKMDYFYNKRKYTEAEIRNIWKIPKDAETEKVKKVIIAPHHAILGYAGIKFSTFPKNAHFLLYLAKKYKDQISFILKPHPNLRYRAVEAGVFENYEAYDAYLAEWNSLENTKVVQEAEYFDIFATSDGMIMDSASFIAEYLYVNKPLLFLTRNGQAFNSLGTHLIEAYYRERGENYEEIERFLEDVIIRNNDNMKKTRSEIFEQELDYVKKNACAAGDYIYNDIVNLIMDNKAE